MTKKEIKDLEDANASAFRAVQQATQGQTTPTCPPGKNPIAWALGQLGASKGGKARAKALSKAERRKIAKNAAISRWGKK